MRVSVHNATRRVRLRQYGCAAILLCLGLAGCTHSPGPGADSAAQTAKLGAANEPPLAVTASRVETRSLLPEIDQAKFGAAALVRTPFGTSSGLVLPASHEVLAHLHIVLTPAKTVTDTIFVNLTSSPRHTERGLRGYAVAQDPTHDLVLLKVEDAPPSIAPPSSRDRDPQRIRFRRRPAAHATGEDAQNLEVKQKPPDKGKIRIVYDGPDTADDGRPQQ
jgi:hypothetical protein